MSQLNTRWTIVGLLFSCTILWIAGCDIPKRPPLRAEDLDELALDSSGSTVDASSNAAETPRESFKGDWESWDAFFVDGTQVGYSHLKAESVGDGNSADVRCELTSRIYVNQGAARLLQQVDLVSTETNDGRLLSFDSSVRVGPATTRFNGAVVDEKLNVETVRGSSRTTQSIEWDPTYRGLIALEQSLRQKPMQTKGELRELTMLLPGQVRLATAKMRCLGKASIPLLDGDLHELIEIDCEIQEKDGGLSYSTIWTDSQGAIARTHSPGLQLIAYRTDKANAAKFESNDQVLAAMPVTGVIREPEKTTRVGYKLRADARAKRLNVDVTISPAPGQYTRAAKDGLIQVLVSRRSENLPDGFNKSVLAPTDEDLSPNFYVDSREQSIQKFLASAVGTQALATKETAVELNRAVHQNIGDLPEPKGFTKASTVGEYWVADSTGKAIFLTALLRGRKIPARLALGLKYVEGESPRLIFHPWTLAYVDGEWIHLDPANGQEAAADRLIVTTTTLHKGDEFEALVPVIQAMQIMQVEIVGQN